MKLLRRAALRRRVFFFAIAIAAVTACYSSDYHRTTAANVSLLSDMSDKLADYCRTYFKLDDRQLSSEEMGEFYYAFNKANAFSSSTPRESSLRSHRDFVKLLNAYEQFAHAADAYRLGGESNPAVLASLLSQHDQVRHLAGKVTEDLRDEPN
ncbi:MAG: hypothetical protein WA993_06725 [Candidatus Binatus sp.]|uniref:hypothetical protein n=1 Tax=Candidatus Binatus sp. TaxID=2811406 RepID=UPI003C973A68